METDPQAPEKRPRDDGSWFTWLAALFASNTASARDTGSGSEANHTVTPIDSTDSSTDSGGGDGGGDGGGGGGD